ncbi:MAG: hypothetical protein NVS1B7_3780 [Candidatus Saccharimonadales bacterium]
MLQYVQIFLLIIIIVRLLKPEILRAIGARNKKIILDSCALIDGRIVDLARSGFVTSTLVVPEFVVHELQLLADGSDTQKRDRARYGLDIIKELQSIEGLIVVLDHTTLSEVTLTDDKLVALCQKLHAQLYTTDFNLQKVAEIVHIIVLNPNDLAQKIRPVALPGERKLLKVIQKGTIAQQGIAYLEDGTMVVIENGLRHIGKIVEVEVNRMHQTVAGKMIFADLVGVKAVPPRSVAAVSSKLQAPLPLRRTISFKTKSKKSLNI